MYELWIDGKLVGTYNSAADLYEVRHNAFVCLTSNVWMHRKLNEIWLVRR